MQIEERTIFITRDDRKRLRRLLSMTPRAHSSARAVERVLGGAEVVSPERLPDNVVTLHTRFRLRSADTGELETAELVLPGERGRGSRRIPVLSPLGRELLGRFVGETVRLRGRSGARVMEVAGIVSGYDPAGCAPSPGAGTCGRDRPDR